jgi:uncharacterized protein YndB with AHSA1/START domain
MTSSDAELGEVTISRIYKAPRELVFECMTTPEHLTHFWGPTGMSAPVENITVDARPGGVFRTVMVNDENGEEYAMSAVFVEFTPPERLSWTEPDVEASMLTTITFHDLGNGTTEAVTVQTNVPAMYLTDEAQAGMQTSFDKFDAYLETLRS